MKISVTILMLMVSVSSIGQSLEAIEARKIVFPNVTGYHTIICDLHQHTVFSDGAVWPSVRVMEAQRDGLDAIAVTEHLEYQPHKDDIPHPDRNRAFEIESSMVQAEELIVIPGSEITRSMPPGHANAIFIKDANKLLSDDYMEVYAEAKKQGAFIFWNHPDWTDQAPDGIARLTEIHRDLIDQQMLHGIEVVNMYTFSEEALSICLQENLTILGTSDVHGLIDWEYPVWFGGHRPVTLVFAEKRSMSSIKDALFAGRTAVWFNNTLIGRVEHLKPLLEASVKVTNVAYAGNTNVLEVSFSNVSDANFTMKNTSSYSLQRNSNIFELPAHTETTIRIKTITRLEGALNWKLEVLNTVVKPQTPATIELNLAIP